MSQTTETEDLTGVEWGDTTGIEAEMSGGGVLFHLTSLLNEGNYIPKPTIGARLLCTVSILCNNQPMAASSGNSDKWIKWRGDTKEPSLKMTAISKSSMPRINKYHHSTHIDLPDTDKRFMIAL